MVEKPRRRKVALLLIVVGVAALGYFLVPAQFKQQLIATVAGSPETGKVRTKPICSQVVVPAGDCIPQHLANLPPDPGPEGKTKFIDVNNNEVRDDVERYIVLNYGHSERAVRALMLVAKQYQYEVEKGESATPEEVQNYTQKVTTKVAGCYIRSVAENIINDRASERVGAEVHNTPERYRQAQKFNSRLHGRVIDMDTSSVTEQCGYNPAALSD